MSMISTQFFASLDLCEVVPPVFYSSRTQVLAQFEGSATAHHLLKAWDSLDLTGIYCAHDRPSVFFREADEPTQELLKKFHCQFWNMNLAPLMVIITPAKALVLTSGVEPAGPNEQISKEKHIVRILNLTAEALTLSKFIQEIETGLIFKESCAYFRREAGVDHCLIQNLADLGKRICENPESPEPQYVHRFLCSVIFLCYLTDRCIIGEPWFAGAGAPGCKNLKTLLNTLEPQVAIEALNRLFQRLKQEFNGSLFDDPSLLVAKMLNTRTIADLKLFFNGGQPASGQLSLGFWPYDFSMIPIELISIIYESFLSCEETKDTGTYYTPFALAEKVVDMALEDKISFGDMKILDPSCGSGIFLVIMFAGLANQWQHHHAAGNKVKALLDILHRRLFGLDLNETACRITCLSLYLAFLDRLEPSDIDGLLSQEGKVLPSLLVNGVSRGIDCGGVYCGDFFDLPIEPAGFDLIIGNPPWKSRKPPESASRWAENKAMAHQLGISAKDMNTVFLPQKELAIGFAWKSSMHLSEGGKACLVLPAKLLLNDYNRFQANWFRQVSVEKVAMLADWRKLLFKNARAPTALIRWSKRLPNDGEMIEYLTPKVTPMDPRRGVIPIFAEDRKRIRNSKVIEEATAGRAPILWKKMFWGSFRDVALIDDLLALPKIGDLTGTPKEAKRWIKGQGFKPACHNEPHEAWWQAEHPFLDAHTKYSYFLFPAECRPIDPKIRKLHRSPSRTLFQSPMVLVNQGFTKVAYCDFSVLFQHAIQSITGPLEDRELLRFLTVVLKSSLADYFLFHTAANIGTERPKVHFNELLSIPFFVPNEAPDPEKASKALAKATRLLNDYEKLLKKRLEDPLFSSDDLGEIPIKLDELVCDYYDLTKNEVRLVQDYRTTVKKSLQPGSLFNKVPTTESPTLEQRRSYLALLTDTLNHWGRRSKIVINGETFLSSGLALVRLTKENLKRSYREHKQNGAELEVLKRVYELLGDKKGHWEYRRDLKIFDKDHLYMVKQMEYRFWTPSHALNDADEIATSILTAGVGP